jgi:very-short-patch-repair endonuclease
MRGPDRKATSRARQLRVDQTDAETKLRHRLRNRQIAGCKFVRQEPIGRFVCDFVCRERKLVIEVDGGQHSEAKADIARDDTLVHEGYRILRFWNNDILGNIEGVLQTIESKLLDQEPLTPTLSP